VPGPEIAAAAPPLLVRELGTVTYGEALELQDRLVRARRAGETPDQLLLLEHPHVITLGTSSHPEHILVDDEQRRLLGIEVHQTGRGGDVTYHGPGQLVGYPILDLKPDRCDLHRYVRDIEEAVIRALADFGIDAGRRPGLTGVWAGAGKVAAIGVRVSSGWITSHGFALNVATDLGFFGSIVPCGIQGAGVTSMSRLLGRDVDMAAVRSRAADRFAEVFGRTPHRDCGPAARNPLPRRPAGADPIRCCSPNSLQRSRLYAQPVRRATPRSGGSVHIPWSDLARAPGGGRRRPKRKRRPGSGMGDRPEPDPKGLWPKAGGCMLRVALGDTIGSPERRVESAGRRRSAAHREFDLG
jgi:lipoyl(octanoyl) transferase